MVERSISVRKSRMNEGVMPRNKVKTNKQKRHMAIAWVGGEGSASAP